jgi:hypothetical protein
VAALAAFNALVGAPHPADDQVPGEWRVEYRSAPGGGLVQRLLANGLHWEPVSAWWRFARELRAILLLGADLVQGWPGQPQDWAAIQVVEQRWPTATEPKDPPGAKDHETEVAARWFRFMRAQGARVPMPDGPTGRAEELADASGRLAAAVHRWLEYGRFMPALRPDVNAEPTQHSVTFRMQLVSHAPEPLCAALALQLVAALESPSLIYVCSHCANPYRARRHPRGERHFCDHCAGRDGKLGKNWASNRQAQQRRRAAGRRTSGPATGNLDTNRDTNPIGSG